MAPGGAAEIGFALLARGDLARAGEAFAEGWRGKRGAPPHPAAPTSAAAAAVVHALAEDHARASGWIARSANGDPADTVAAQPIAGIARALVAIGSLDRVGAERALRYLDEQSVRDDLRWIVAVTRARAALLWDDRRRALGDVSAALDADPSFARGTSYAGAMLRAVAADIYHSLGEVVAAGRIVEGPGGDLMQSYAPATAVRGLLVSRRWAEAEALLTPDEHPDDRALARRSVLRANLARLTHRADSTRMIERAVEEIQRTGALDAAQEALPTVYAGLIERMPGVLSSNARFVVPPVIRLTAREEQVLGLLAAHASIPEIASLMFVSRNTVKTHLRALYRKLGVSNRAQALDAAARFLNRDHKG